MSNVVSNKNSEVEPLIQHNDEENQIVTDQAIAQQIAEEEAIHARPVYNTRRPIVSGNSIYQPEQVYYYGSWNGRPIYRQRPVVVVRDDPETSYLLLSCFLTWSFVLIFIILLTIFYSS
mmetsp:Transcript_17079/g.15424  ORF Transcript_17079/g.15424 Transcript_17079/m.15424 type:complete len:119 (+) Transcript_17079:78-434(+)